MAKVLITGASGFIGTHLVSANITQGNTIRGLLLQNDPKKNELQKLGVEIMIGDMRNIESLRQACSGMDIIFHCAGVVTDWAPWKLFHEVNVKGMENLCQTAVEAGVKRLVYMSTNDVFGLKEGIVMDETFPYKKWGEPYSDTKIDAEEIAWKYYNLHKLPITMVYGTWIFGKGDTTFIPTLAEAILKKNMLFWRKNVHVWPCYIDNLIDFLMLISTEPCAIGNGYLIHDGEMTTLQELCQEIAKAMEMPPVKTRIPYFLALGIAWMMEKWALLIKRTRRPLLTTYSVKNLGSRLEFSIEKAKRELGWTPKIKYKEGLQITLEWLKNLDLDTYLQK
ncbi:MAG: NAD-dependent epimerase/dehydratase family protein [Candidatus Lokiarchaeota archaeon]|nr:NAD-dependent epimerase/dehydratase family protein [Candidatus Lokiarchaeota archaeon]